jgi:molybdopterin/thiamine biosynthesis adenylyltransferase
MELELSSRYAGIVNNLHEYSFHILGCGAIGSSAAIQLARSGAMTFFLYDMDKVEGVNIGVSQYDVRHVGIEKVKALDYILTDINPDSEITPVNGEFKEYYYNGDKDIAILAFDTMNVRMDAVKVLCANSKQKPLCIIDGRMGAEHYQQYIIPKPDTKKYEKIWYSDNDMSTDPCNAKATSYCSNMSGSFIANAVRKFVTGQPFNGNFSFNFPTMMMNKI